MSATLASADTVRALTFRNLSKEDAHPVNTARSVITAWRKANGQQTAHKIAHTMAAHVMRGIVRLSREAAARGLHWTVKVQVDPGLSGKIPDIRADFYVLVPGSGFVTVTIEGGACLIATRTRYEVGKGATYFANAALRRALRGPGASFTGHPWPRCVVVGFIDSAPGVRPFN